MKTYLALAIAIIGLGLTSWALWERSQGLKLERDSALVAKAKAEATIATMKEDARIASENRINYLDAQEASKREIDRLKSELTRIPERVFIRGTCPELPEAADTRGSAGTTCEVGAEVRAEIERIQRSMVADIELAHDLDNKHQYRHDHIVSTGSK